MVNRLKLLDRVRQYERAEGEILQTVVRAKKKQKRPLIILLPGVHEDLHLAFVHRVVHVEMRLLELPCTDLGLIVWPGEFNGLLRSFLKSKLMPHGTRLIDIPPERYETRVAEAIEPIRTRSASRTS